MLTLTDSALPPDGAWRHDIIEILDLLPVGVEIYSRDLEAMFFNKFSDALFNYDGRAITHFDDWWEEGFPDPREREFRLRVIREKLVLIELDVTDQRIMEAELRHIGSIDTLTDTANRRAFMERAERALADARAAPAALSVLMIDIDHFKSINDRFGHSTGDEVLVAVATRIRANLREEEVLARIGGEEFAIAMPGIAGEAARAAADRVRTAICGSSVASAIGAVDVTVSIGATEYAGGEDTVEDLLRQADQALYEAKARGRNCVVWAVAGG